ncbi:MULTISPECIES: MobV family relaxase [Bacillus cereus group]|uniref:MobV family relaxase n=3 Tax=Bacteria TaxID=2 RepID=A0AAW9JGB0_BACTU|nr:MULTISPECIES: MobV family relaxase [Bacillus cereus group]EJP80915.1 plasmid recombination enzyme [Bacillus cereus VD022]EOQ53574.1 plasmid recombination enzyme [Bacillus cereus TIAC219]MDZ5480732.1 MobV family relaxase [Bacillus thuringiensis]NUW47452.1 plasmid recombination protein [Bacillus thuringiensis]USP56486.1 Plasmid recombination enzyme [Bacillus thuringiensis]
MNKFAIIHMQKFQISDVQGIQKHNQRQGKSKSNLDIDYSKSEQNYDLLNQQKIRYESTIKQEISERVKRKPRANSVVLSEFVVTASPDYMHSLSLEEQKRYFESSLDFIQKRYGKQNTLYAMVHMDEATPHMHIGVMPITEDNRLSAKDMFTRKELISLQQDFPLEMREKGFDVERGEGSEKKHLSPQAFKEKQDLEVEVEQLSNVKTHLKTKVVETHNQLQQTTNYIEKQNETLQKIQQQFLSLDKKIKEKKQEFETFRNQIPDKPVSMSYLREETKTEVTTKLFGKPEITEKKTGNIVVTREQWRDMTEKVNAAVIIKSDYERLQKTDLVKENKQLHEAVDEICDSLQDSQKRNLKLQKENKQLSTEISSLKAHIRDLQINIKVLYQQTKKVFKEQFKAFRGLIKNELDMKGVDNQFEREHTREIRSRQKGYDMER